MMPDEVAASRLYHLVSLAMHIGLLTEHELTRPLHMLDTIQEKLGIENDQASELTDLDRLSGSRETGHGAEAPDQPPTGP
jgi:hypothetical protein